MPGATITIPPIWRVVTLDERARAGAEPARPGEIVITLRAGPGFGTGAHETTQLCLQAIYAFHPRGRAWRLLDFGSGSGVLSIAGARLGAEVEAVEIDELALEHAEANARLNAVHPRVRAVRTLAEVRGAFDVVVANILLPVLTEAALELVARRAAGGALVLSGLVGTDVPSVIARYAPLLGGERPEIYERGDWRALAWTR